ncbi:biotin-dependent carboxyltransferase family protein [Lewinella sp. JB7]|uniref:biotin-dependent carboxyltransferase family protein n=1 Tax=Lewinella sp. JB7 TaxID=2962887 RepID=UPI0020C95B19|nr:biotin-dependent carboxyltransferase family protein [Lewinella sp. JB7]MCP9235949.1 biotin-dependent carboxyltransferase family protein [Lewinella sp. JB7]
MARSLTLTCCGSGAGAYLVDGGRAGYGDRGIPSGGPADAFSARAANHLLDQPAHHCCLEITLHGGRWLLEGTGQMAITGADMNWRLNGSPVDHHQVHYLDGAYLLTGGVAARGCRSYLGIRGDWNATRILGSVEAGLPGTARVTRGFTVDVISAEEAPFRSDWPRWDALTGTAVLHAHPGPEWPWLNVRERQWLLQSVFTVDADSNRQGIRLRTPAGESFPLPSMISSPVLPGTVQLTSNGPILLGPEAQTVGGYPRVLLVNNLGDAYQLRPGQSLRFQQISRAPA